jgi:hypothetical protein
MRCATTLGIVTIRATIINIITLSITTLRLIHLFASLNIDNTQHNYTQRNSIKHLFDECCIFYCYAECRLC